MVAVGRNECSEDRRGGRSRGCRGSRDGVLAPRADGRGAPPRPKPYSTAGDALRAAVDVRRRVRVEMRTEGDFAVGGAGMPGEAGADTVGPVVAAESIPCVDLLEKGVGWAAIVTAAGVSAEPVPPSVDTSRTASNAASAAGKIDPRPGQRSAAARTLRMAEALATTDAASSGGNA